MKNINSKQNSAIVFQPSFWRAISLPLVFLIIGLIVNVKDITSTFHDKFISMLFFLVIMQFILNIAFYTKLVFNNDTIIVVFPFRFFNKKISFSNQEMKLIESLENNLSRFGSKTIVLNDGNRRIDVEMSWLSSNQWELLNDHLNTTFKPIFSRFLNDFKY